MNLPTPAEVHAHVQPGFLQPPLLLRIYIAALVYLRGWFSLRREFPNLVPVWRVVAFIGGVSSVWTAVASPLTALDHQLLTIHMLKHLLLMAVGAPLILFGDSKKSTAGFASEIARSLTQSRVVLAGRHHHCHRMARSCRLPTGFGNPRGGMLRGTVAFLLAGLLFWWPVVQSRPGSGQRWFVLFYIFSSLLLLL